MGATSGVKIIATNAANDVTGVKPEESSRANQAWPALIT
jgi:hypothetical protein